MKKIIHTCLTGGYTEELNYQENSLTKYQALAGYDVTVITTQYCYIEGIWGPCMTENDYRNQYGVHVIRLPFALPVSYNINRQIGLFKGTLEKITEINPDIFFIHNIQFQDLRIIAKYAKEHPSVQLFVDNHSDFTNSARNWLTRNTLYRFYWNYCAKAVIPYVKMFYGVLPARVDFLRTVYGVPKEKTELLVMGADDESVEKATRPEVKKAFREKYSIKDDDFLIVTGGKIDNSKTQTILLMQAVQNIENKKLCLVVFGFVAPELMYDMKKLCDGRKVQYIGWAKGEQSYEYFASADLVVFPGRHSVYWEQVAGIGIPMICKYWNGTTHIDIGGNVEFLEGDSTKKIENKLVELLNDHDKFKMMKSIAQSNGRQVFSYKLISEKSINIL